MGNASIIKPDEALHGDVNGNIIKATLTGDGKICIDGKYYRCNRSCPPPEVACGLDGYGLSQGVM